MSRRAEPLDWVLRGLAVLTTVLAVLYRPSFALVIVPVTGVALLIAFVHPTATWRLQAIGVMCLGCVVMGADLLGYA